MRIESSGASYLALPDGVRPYPGVVVIHEASGLNDNIRGICRRFAAEGYAALGVDLFDGRNRAVCMARMFAGGMAGNLDYYSVPALKAALGGWPAILRSMLPGSAPAVSAWAVPSS
jgi:carboxymethylenebutenolidase